MDVYSKFNKPYRLSKKPVRKMYDGSIFDVISDPGLQVKIFDKQYCTDEMERRVEDAIFNGMMEPPPQEVIYSRNRFAGYVLQKTSAVVPDVQIEDVPARHVFPEPKNDKVQDENQLPLLVLIVVGVLASIILYAVIFPSMASTMDATISAANLKGIPMIVGGWVILVVVSGKTASWGWGRTVLGILGFVFGAALICGLITVLVGLFFAATSILYALLPTVITVVIIISIVKALIHH